MNRWQTYIILLLFNLPGMVDAGTTGKIIGIVTDKDQNTPLPGANVVLDPIPQGATADSTGRYVILNVPAGTYSLKGSFIGYQETVTRNVLIVPDMTTTINFQLAEQALQAREALEVIAQRPLIQKNQTASVRLITAQEIAHLPLRGFEELTALQAGVTQWNDRIYIRGGRLEEVDYIVDGVSQRDLQTGISSTAINSNAIDQVVIIVGGFEAEYGRVMSGVVKVVTKEGRQRYTGTAEYITDGSAGHPWLGAPSFGYNALNASLGGPIVPAKGRAFFFVSGEWRHHKDRNPRQGVRVLPVEQDQLDPDARDLLSKGLLPHNSLDGRTWQAKLTTHLTDNEGRT